MRLFFNGPTAPFLDDASITDATQRNIVPSYSSSVDRNPRLVTISFGDGYSQRAADGINYTPMVFDLTFENRSQAVIKAIYNFFFGESSYYDRAPEEPFFWTPPSPFDSKVRLFTFSNLRVKYETYGSSTLTVTLTESYEP